MKMRSFLIFASWMMVFFTVTIIYNFSEETAVRSAQTSGSVVRDVLEAVMPEEEVTDEMVKNKVTYFISKDNKTIGEPFVKLYQNGEVSLYYYNK